MRLIELWFFAGQKLTKARVKKTRAACGIANGKDPNWFDHYSLDKYFEFEGFKLNKRSKLHIINNVILVNRLGCFARNRNKSYNFALIPFFHSFFLSFHVCSVFSAALWPNCGLPCCRRATEWGARHFLKTRPEMVIGIETILAVRPQPLPSQRLE